LAALAVGGMGCGGDDDDQPAAGGGGDQAGQQDQHPGAPGDQHAGAPGGQHAGQPVAGQPAGGPPAPGTRDAGAEGGRTQAAGPASSDPIDYVTPDFVLAVVVHPKRAFDSELSKQLQQQMLEVAGLNLDEQLEGFIQAVGVDPRTLEEATLLVDENTARMGSTIFMMRGGAGPPEAFEVEEKTFPPPGSRPEPPPQENGDAQPEAPGGAFSVQDPPQFEQPDAGAGPGFGPDPEPLMLVPTPTMIFRFSQDVDPQMLMGRLPAQLQNKTHAGRQYYVAQTPGGPMAAFFPSNRMMIVSSEPLLQKMLTAKDAESPVIKQLRAAKDEYDAMLVVNLLPQRAALQQMTQQVRQDVPQPFQGLLELPAKVKTITAVADASTAAGGNLLTLSIEADDSEAAKQIEQVLGGLVGFAKAAYQDWRAAGAIEAPAYTEELLPVADSLVERMTTETTGDVFTLTVGRPEGYEKLPELLRPAIEDAQRQAQVNIQRNKLKQIGLAFHNYHDTHGEMPNAGAGAGGAGQGLSWRVHLLPQLDEQALYEQFNLDEPWDSEQNKALIEQMPDVYAPLQGEPNGKTSMHVFIGENAAFGGETGPKFAQITDGASNTILVVEAGPDTAVEWTKPGGLELNPENPKEALGDIPEGGLNVLMMDGAVRRVAADIADMTLKALITPRGKEVVEEF
ncbi:MAG: DUF1559 domain-containing protein, partial [Planctomycetes bacterium]|nr:DUF1559 domain-containing protein [Planctomycetota bacterium]